MKNNRLQAEMLSPLRISLNIKLRISYKDHVTNVDVRNRIQHAIRRIEDLLTTLKRRKLKWYGHVSRSSGLVMTILLRHCEGNKKKGKTKEATISQRQRVDRTGFPESQRGCGRQTDGL